MGYILWVWMNYILWVWTIYCDRGVSLYGVYIVTNGSAGWLLEVVYLSCALQAETRKKSLWSETDRPRLCPPKQLLAVRTLRAYAIHFVSYHILWLPIFGGFTLYMNELRFFILSATTIYIPLTRHSFFVFAVQEKEKDIVEKCKQSECLLDVFLPLLHLHLPLSLFHHQCKTATFNNIILDWFINPFSDVFVEPVVIKCLLISRAKNQFGCFGMDFNGLPKLATRWVDPP